MLLRTALGRTWRSRCESATALAFDPSLDLAHVARMRALYHVGRFDEAFAEASLARTLNPRPGVELARLEIAVQLFAGRFDEAARRADDLLQRTDAPAMRHYLGLSQFYLGSVDAARQTLASVSRADQPDVRAQALASIEAASGMRDQALARVRTIERRDDIDHHVAYSLGAAWVQLGDSAASVRWLRQAADTGASVHVGPVILHGVGLGDPGGRRCTGSGGHE